MGSYGSGHDEARGEHRPPWVRIQTADDDAGAGLPALRAAREGWQRHVDPRDPEPEAPRDLAA